MGLFTRFGRGYNLKRFADYNPTAVFISLPFMAVYAVSNVIFLLLLAKPFGEKLERVKIKYGV